MTYTPYGKITFERVVNRKNKDNEPIWALYFIENGNAWKEPSDFKGEAFLNLGSLGNDDEEKILYDRDVILYNLLEKFLDTIRIKESKTDSK